MHVLPLIQENPGTRQMINGVLKECEMPKPNLTWNDIDVEQKRLLGECDYTILPDSPLSAEKKAEWTAYRQAVRLVNNTFSNPNEVIWPEKP